MKINIYKTNISIEKPKYTSVVSEYIYYNTHIVNILTRSNDNNYLVHLFVPLEYILTITINKYDYNNKT